MIKINASECRCIFVLWFWPSSDEMYAHKHTHTHTDCPNTWNVQIKFKSIIIEFEMNGIKRNGTELNWTGQRTERNGTKRNEFKWYNTFMLTYNGVNQTKDWVQQHTKADNVNKKRQKFLEYANRKICKSAREWHRTNCKTDIEILFEQSANIKWCGSK